MSNKEPRKVLLMKSRALNDVRNHYIQLEELFEQGYRIARSTAFDDRCSAFPNGRVTLYLEGEETPAKETPVKETSVKEEVVVEEVVEKAPAEVVATEVAATEDVPAVEAEEQKEEAVEEPKSEVEEETKEEKKKPSKRGRKAKAK